MTFNSESGYLRLPAPAKLNLFLRITGRRSDGYHELQTIFQLLDWGDEVELEHTRDPAIIRGKAIEGVTPEADLSVRAALALQALAVERGRPAAGARITVHKRIPQGSGLGGASTDAATVLHGLNVLWGCGFTVDELAGLGLGLGADVPVFVRGHSAWAGGIGEQLTPLSLGERWYVLVFPGEGASTAALFADPDLCRNATPLPQGRMPPPADRINDFLPVLMRRSEPVARAFEHLSEHGTVRLSGSGSTLFLEAADKMTANRLTTALKKHYNVGAVRGTDQSILLDHLSRQEHER